MAAIGLAGTSRFRLCFDRLIFEWDRDGPVVAFAAAGADDTAIEDAFSRSVLPFVLHTRGTQALHASAVLFGQHGLCVLCARSETGKSTLAYALGQRPGASLWADDAVAFEVTPEGAWSPPLPFSLRLRPRSAEHFGRVQEPSVAGPHRSAPARISTILVLEKDPDPSSDDITIDRLSGTASFTALLEHAYCFSFAPELTRRTSSTYLALAAHVPVFSVKFPGHLEHIPTIAGAIEDLHHEYSFARSAR